jgi:hypothetical protein
MEDWEHDSEDDSRKKWKHKELRQPIKWTGPTLPPTLPPRLKGPALSPQSPFKMLLDQPATEAELEEHQRSWNEADNKYLAEQLRKLPLLAQEYAIDAPNDAWVGMVERNDAWVLGLLLALARGVVSGFGVDFGSRRGPRNWNEVAQAELIADVEAVKARRNCGDSETCRILVSSSRYKERYGRNPRRLSSQKRARSLNTRLVEARNAKTIVARLLANADGKSKQLLIDYVISLYACDSQDAASAKARADALWKSMTDKLKELEARG